MLRRVYRQRRRILFGSTLLVLALLVADRTQPGGLSMFEGLEPQGRVMLVSTLLACFASLGAALVALFPAARPVIEVTALAGLAQATVIFLLPDPLVAAMWGTGFATIMLFLLYVAIHLGLYGTMADQIPTWFSTNTRSVFRVDAAPETVWRQIVPDCGHEPHHWTGTLRRVDPDPEEPDTVHASFALGGNLAENKTITFLDKRPPHHCCYYFISDAEGTNANFAEGEYEIRIAPLADGGTRVETTLRRSAMHLRLALMMWFDDAAGDQADSIRAGLGSGGDWSVTGHFNRQIQRAA